MRVVLKHDFVMTKGKEYYNKRPQKLPLKYIGSIKQTSLTQKRGATKNNTYLNMNPTNQQKSTTDERLKAKNNLDQAQRLPMKKCFGI